MTPLVRSNASSGPVRTFTFMSPAGHDRNPNLNVFPVKSRKFSSGTSESSEISYNLEPELQKSFPKPSPSADKILENMIKHFKIHKSVSLAQVSDLPIDTCKQIVEKLISEKLSLSDELSVKNEEIPENPENQDKSLDLGIPSAQVSPPPMKMQAFRALENVSPIEKDDSVGHTNYKIISLALTPHEDLNPNPIAIKSSKYEDYKREVLKLANELRELTAYNQLLSLILSLEKDNESIQLANQVKEKVDIYIGLIENITEMMKKLRKNIEPSEGFWESVPLYRQEVKILAKMVGFEALCDFKPSEMQTVNDLLDISLEDDPKKLEIYIDEVLAGHDIAEISYMLVKYIKYLEEQAALPLKSEALNCLITEVRNEFALEECVNEKLIFASELAMLENEINRLKYEQSRALKIEQVRIREKNPSIEKRKWKLPENMEKLSGPELYSKALARCKKK